MREILFRGETKDNVWYHGFIKGKSLPNFEGNKLEFTPCIIEQPYADIWVIPETVGQYTGLTDKNGMKIFEGDICKHRSNYSGEFIISVVTYTDGCFLAVADNNSGFNLSDNLEVIGNIHDNLELLKGGVEE